MYQILTYARILVFLGLFALAANSFVQAQENAEPVEPLDPEAFDLPVSPPTEHRGPIPPRRTNESEEDRQQLEKLRRLDSYLRMSPQELTELRIAISRIEQMSVEERKAMRGQIQDLMRTRGDRRRAIFNRWRDLEPEERAKVFHHIRSLSREERSELLGQMEQMTPEERTAYWEGKIADLPEPPEDFMNERERRRQGPNPQQRRQSQGHSPRNGQERD